MRKLIIPACEAGDSGSIPDQGTNSTHMFYILIDLDLIAVAVALILGYQYNEMVQKGKIHEEPIDILHCLIPIWHLVIIVGFIYFIVDGSKILQSVNK